MLSLTTVLLPPTKKETGQIVSDITSTCLPVPTVLGQLVSLPCLHAHDLSDDDSVPMFAGTIVVFALIYLGVSRLGSDRVDHSSFCGLDIHTLTEALYFSLSTMTTIGYGVSDYYFGDCWTPFLLVLCQVFCAITYDAVAIGLLFTRMSRGQKRGRTIIFSDVACIRKVREKHYLLFRVGELTRNRSIIAAKVRVHCVRHERHPIGETEVKQQEQHILGGPVPIETTHYQTHHVHLLSPDEAVGAPLLLSLPQVIVHALDTDVENASNSPLLPSAPVWYDRDGNANVWPPRTISETERGENDRTNAASRVGAASAAGAAGAAAGLLLAGPLVAAGAGLEQHMQLQRNWGVQGKLLVLTMMQVLGLLVARVKRRQVVHPRPMTH